MENQRELFIHSNLNRRAAKMSFKAKRAWGLYILGVSFLIAPFMNAAIALKMLGHAEWYLPTVWFWALANRADVWAQALYLVTFVSGCLLFVAKRWSQGLSLVVVLMSLAVNLRFNIYKLSNISSPFFFGSILSFIAIFIILFYFRYPYLDRRRGGRVPMALAVVCKQFPDLSLQSSDISKNGIRIDLRTGKLNDLSVGQTIELKIADFTLDALVLNVAPTQFNARFVNMTRAKKQKLRMLLKNNG